MLISFLVDTDRRVAPLDPSVSGRVRAEQLDVALRLAPFTVLVSISVVQVIVYLFWSSGVRPYLIGLEVFLAIFASLALERCWRWRSNPKPREVGRRFVAQVTLVAHFYGWLLGSIPVALFVDATAPERLLIASSCAGLIATCMSLAVMPRAAIAYATPIVACSFAALAMTGESFHIYVAILLAFYAAFIFFTIVHLSRLVTMRVMAQVDLERQQGVTNLLLNDFEENASDWLWETDSELRLQHVSARLVEVARSSEASLQKLPLARLFAPAKAQGAGRGPEALWRHILERRPFRNILLPMQIEGESRWWSLSGKPIFSHAGVFSGYRGVGSDITERKRSEERLSHLAMHDSLTDLPNRLSFQQGLEEATAQLDSGEGFALFCLDLDQFKSVNDSFGHAAGDALLQAVAQRLRALVGPSALLARLAGDEFAILLSGPTMRERSVVEALARKIVAEIGAPYNLEGIRINVGASVGIALAPHDGRREIMRRADLALYRTKREGRSGHRFYEAEMDERVEETRALAAELRGALERDEFVLYFQPLVDARDGRIQGFETLLRWRHPERGFVSPAQFIPLAEETGVIIPLGEWIVREACRIAASWPAPLHVAVNISPIQFRHSDLPALVRAAIEESGLAAERLELEVTESVLLEATPATHAMLRTLRAMGVHLSLDDFGTGYSSLSYLRRIPFDKIKIDQSFVRGLPHEQSDLAIVRAVVDIGSSLGMTITAEGVETEAQRLCLLQQGCQQFQGFLFSKPMPAHEAKILAEAPLAARGRVHAA